VYNYKISSLGIDFQLPINWSEITIQKFADYQDLVKQLQKQFVETFSLKDETEIAQVTTIEIFIKMPSYFTKIISFWSGLSLSDVYKIDKNDVLACYTHMNKFLANNTTETGIDKFTFKGAEYLFPGSKSDINGNTALMADETFGAMIYAFQQNKSLEELGKGRFEAVAAQMAILCRPKGEEYDPDKSNVRALEFKQLPMDIVWEFVFFSIRQTSRFKKLTETYLKEGEEKTNLAGGGGITPSTKLQEKT